MISYPLISFKPVYRHACVVLHALSIFLSSVFQSSSQIFLFCNYKLHTMLVPKTKQSSVTQQCYKGTLNVRVYLGQPSLLDCSATQHFAALTFGV